MDNKFIFAKINDKAKTSNSQNKITNSEFLNEFDMALIEKEMISKNKKNYILYGGYKDAVRKIIIFYPDKIGKEDVIKNINNIISCIKIKLPEEINGRLKHKDYLGTIISFGLTRERIGDIIVYDDKAYIVVLKENSEYIKNELMQEKRFKKAKIEIIDIEKIKPKPIEYESIKISVNSLRLDNIISEIIKTSRKKAQENIQEERVFINYKLETKNTKAIKENDLIVIRGNGKYIIDKMLGKNKNGKDIIEVKKFK